MVVLIDVDRSKMSKRSPTTLDYVASSRPNLALHADNDYFSRAVLWADTHQFSG
jgi:hypothetical protein